MILKDKVVFITGASSGIGHELASVLFSKGAKLAIAARRVELLEELKNKLGTDVLVFKTDVTDREAVNQAVEMTVKHFGQLDIIINNAGLGYFGTIAAMLPEHMEKVLGTNIYGALNSTQAAIPHLKKSHGMIVNISSGLSKRALPFLSFYAGTKSMLDALSDGMRMELRGYGIKVLNYCPPAINTGFAGSALKEPELLRASESNMKQASLPDVVRRMVDAIEKEKREVVDGGGFLKTMNFFAPKFLDNLFYKVMVKRMLKQ